MRIILQVNAVRFQTGRYLLAFVPSGGLPTTDLGYQASFKTHATSLTNITQLPHVEVDLATQTHAELDIPWDNIYPYFINQSTYPVGIGNVLFRPYVALSAASGDTTCGYSIFAAFKDIHLIAATVTQSSYGEKEQKKAGIGPVESGLSKIGKAASVLGEIPLLTAGAATVSWTASILARAAHVFGWSKPVDISPAKTMVQRPFRFLANSDGEAVSESLAGMSTNRVISHPRLGGTTADEMSFDYLKSIYAYSNSATWTSAAAAGASLYLVAVHPTIFQSPIGSGTVMTPICFLAQNFALWRGSLKVRLKLVKNEFYSGRFVVWFQPNYHGTSVLSTLAQTEYTQRVVVDIRECAEMEFVIPYVSPEMYTNVGTSIGSFGINVLDPLVAPSSVPSSITIIIEVAGGEDLQFALPVPTSYETWIPAVTQSLFSAETQSAYEFCPIHNLGQPDDVDMVNAASVSAGEKFESLRQLTRMYSMDLPTVGGLPFIFLGNQILYIRPFLHQVVTQATSNSTPVNRGKIHSSWTDVISSCYAMETGSIRQILQATDNTRSLIVGLNLSGTTNDIYKATTGSAGVNSNLYRLIVEEAVGSPGDFNVPSYQKTIGRAVAAGFYSTGVPMLQPTSGPGATVMVQNTNFSAVNNYYLIGRVGSDDYNCYGFISVPALILRGQS